MVNNDLLQDLSLLHDIHLPSPVSWWPLAPGWYLVAVAGFAIGLFIICISYRYYFNGLAKRQALRELTNIEKQYKHHADSQQCTAHISELLKRVALIYYPRTKVAGLQGEAWLSFLNQTSKKIDFNSVRTQLLELPWRPSHGQQLQPLFKIARQWIIKQRKPCLN